MRHAMLLLLMALLLGLVPASAPAEDAAPAEPPAPAAAPEALDADDHFWQGINLLHGRGVPRDAAAATESFRLAAEQGHARAQMHMGMAYLKGRGVAVDRRAALDWFLLAADQGHTKAQLEAGTLLLDAGSGIRRDPVEGAKWLLLALRSGGPLARATAPPRIKSLSAQQLELARERARAWRDEHEGAPEAPPST